MLESARGAGDVVAALLLLNLSFLWVGKSLKGLEAVSEEHSWLWPQPSARYGTGRARCFSFTGLGGPGEEQQGGN